MSDVFFPLNVLSGSFWGHLFQYANAPCCPLLSSNIAQKCGGQFHGRATKKKGKISQLEIEDIFIYSVSPWLFSWGNAGRSWGVCIYQLSPGTFGSSWVSLRTRQETKYVNCGDIKAVSQAGM